MSNDAHNSTLNVRALDRNDALNQFWITFLRHTVAQTLGHGKPSRRPLRQRVNGRRSVPQIYVQRTPKELSPNHHPSTFCEMIKCLPSLSLPSNQGMLPDRWSSAKATTRRGKILPQPPQEDCKRHRSHVPKCENARATNLGRQS